MKKLGLWAIVLLTINSIIGSGIFLSPGSVAKQVGSLAPLVYVVAALFAAILAVTFASASKYVSKNGAAYAYAKAAFGKNVGLYVGVTRFTSAAIAWGVIGTAFINTTLKILNIENSFTNITVGFVILMIVLLVITLLGNRAISFISNLSTIGKLIALIVPIISGIVVIILTGQNNLTAVDQYTVNAQNVIPELSTSIFVTAIISAFYAFTGFETIATGSNDMENPEKNLPIAIPLAIGIIALVYVGTVFVGMAVDSIAMVTTTETVALAGVFKNPMIKHLITLGALVSMFGISVASSFHTPRVAEALAQDGFLPEIFKHRNCNNVPVAAFLLTFSLAMIVPMAFQYNMQGIMIISSISRFVQFLVVPAAVISFYIGKSKETITTVHKNIIVDVIVPVIAIILTIILLVKFNWKGQFSITVNGISTLNWYAIAAMIIGYVVLPIIAYFYRKRKVE